MSNLPPTTQRLLSLDAFRGLTIAAMILVNNPGSWGHMFAPLSHASWNGCTPTDLVFPFFLLIVGVAMAFSFGKRSAGTHKAVLIAHVLRRSVILFLLGMSMYAYPNWRLLAPLVMVLVGLVLFFPDEAEATQRTWRHKPAVKALGFALALGGVVFFALDFGYFQETNLRVPGVLQRIGLCYFGASIIVLALGRRGTVVATAVLLIGYTLIVEFVAPPAGYTAQVTGPKGLLHNWVDEQVLGEHLYRERPDPEGLLSTLPAIATTLIGVLVGWWLRSPRERYVTLAGLFIAGNASLLFGLALDSAVPMNKKIWTASYVLYTAGVALQVLGVCYWLIDIRGWRRWAGPLLVFGSNAIVVFVASGLMAKTLGRWRIGAEDTPVSRWVYEEAFASWADPKTASLLYAITFVLIWLALMVPLYRRRVFIKI